MKPEINKHIELVQVLLYLSDCQDKTNQVLSNIKYRTAIDAYFAPFRSHDAVKITSDLILNTNFIHIKPLRAVLQLDRLAADNSDTLHTWAISVKDFIKETNFDTFYTSQNDYYNAIINKITSCDFNSWITFIGDYFRQEPTEFRLIICPINGNYGFNLDYPMPNTSYVVQCMPNYDIEGKEIWRFDFFAKGIAHEYAHCFVNPVVEGHKDLLNSYKPFFVRHTNMLDYYNVDYAVMNEYWVRAFAIRFMEENSELFPEFNIKAEYDRQREVFIYINEFVKLLKTFEKGREPFKEFYLSNVDVISTF